ncbi:MAG: type II CAAX endopeptidase family protein [Bacteroidota bacterium]
MKNKNWKHTLSRALLFCLCNVIIMILSGSLTNEFPKPWSDILHGTIVILCIFGITIPFARWEKLTLAEIGVVPNRKTIRRFTYGFAIGILIAITYVLLVVCFTNSKLVAVRSISFSSVSYPFVFCFVFALREELAFRGFPLRSLAYSMGSWKALIIIALIFALEHWAGDYTFKNAFLGSSTGAILFGIAALTTKGIALPVGLHMAWNFGLWCFGFNFPGIIWQRIIEKESETGNEPLIWTIYLVVMGLSVLGFYLYGRKKKASQGTQQ